MGARRSCPRCESRDVARKPQDGISPLPGYTCRGCGAALRSPGTGALYAAVLLICVGLLAFFSMPLWADIPDGQPDIYYLIAAAGVGAYAVRQLLRPTPRPVSDPGAD